MIVLNVRLGGPIDQGNKIKILLRFTRIFECSLIEWIEQLFSSFKSLSTLGYSGMGKPA